MIVVTGSAGFIASCLVSQLNEMGHSDLILVDDFSKEEKKENYSNKAYAEAIDRNEFIAWFSENAQRVDFVYHLGARTDTTEFDRELLTALNVTYSQEVWKICTENNIPLVYASSAATYGLGEHGYDDRNDLPSQLIPLNPYGDSKNDFDLWALAQDQAPPHWKGVKFFNVYGPNEYHKGRMASVIMHTFNQVSSTGAMKLFRSHNPEYKDGEQLRDFVYVKDVVSVLTFLQTEETYNGLINLGTGTARSFLDLAKATFAAMGVEEDISFIDTPIDIRDKYQYFTEANMDKLRSLGYEKPFYSLEEGVTDYVKGYLMDHKYM
ncbi:MAG: ADP-glyceromanno-heptose 6-epimerase [Schleiferiaceae bacterium]